MQESVADLVAAMRSGAKSALARLITLVENESPQMSEILERIQPHVGRAYCVGITGPPGVGKSTLVDKLTSVIRREGLSVGIVAVDPSSPLSGGAMLGDRVRMEQHYLDKEVFIRSMATRGAYGGLSKATKSVIRLLDAFGKDIILVETSGVGQVEVSISELADTTVLVLGPEFGDSIQLMKGGIIEVADIIVINKADRAGVEGLTAEIKEMLAFDTRKPGRPVVLTQAENSVGISDLYRELERVRQKGERPENMEEALKPASTCN